MPRTIAAPPAPTAPDVQIAEIERWLSTVPADAELAALADGLAAAYDALEADLAGATALRRKRATLVAALSEATGTDRTKLIQDLVLINAESSVLPTLIGEGTRRYVLARLAYLRRLLALAEAEARGAVERTNGPIGDLGRARLNLARASGELGVGRQAAHVVDGLSADVRRQEAALRPDVEAHERATMVAAMARARVAGAFGDNVWGFASSDRTTRTWEFVAGRSAEAATARARREIAS